MASQAEYALIARDLKPLGVAVVPRDCIGILVTTAGTITANFPSGDAQVVDLETGWHPLVPQEITAATAVGFLALKSV